VKVLVCGGRNYNDREFVRIVLDRIQRETPITLLIHGACGWDRDKDNSDRPMTGADRWADEWAHARGVPCERMPARWGRYGIVAGAIRNREMLVKRPDIVVAFPGERGTRNCVDQARHLGISVEHAARDPAEAALALREDIARNQKTRRKGIGL